jgi:hypothetical protein
LKTQSQEKDLEVKIVEALRRTVIGENISFREFTIKLHVKPISQVKIELAKQTSTQNFQSLSLTNEKCRFQLT